MLGVRGRGKGEYWDKPFPVLQPYPVQHLAPEPQPDPVLAVLIDLRCTLTAMDARIQHLEGAGALGAAPVAAAVGVLAAQEIRPSYTLVSALPASASVRCYSGEYPRPDPGR